MRTETGRRRAALDGLLRILEAAGLEELFGGPDEEALFLYHLIHEVARGRSSPYYWEICHTGRRRGVAAPLPDGVVRTRSAESLEILAAAWSSRPVHHHGRNHIVDGVSLRPVPRRPGRHR